MKKFLLVALMAPLTAFAQTYPSPTFNSLTLQNPLAPSNGGTGVANTGTITLSGNLSTSGGFPLAWNLTGNTSLTLPTSGSLATQSYVQSTASNPGTPVSVGSSLYPSIVSPISTTATSTSGSNTITVTNASGITVGMGVYATFANPRCSSTLVGYFNTYVTAISGNTVTLSCNATATNSSPVSVQFGQQRYSTSSSIVANDVGTQTLKVGSASQGNSASWLDQISTGQDYRLTSAAQIVTPPGGGYALTLASRTSDATGGAVAFPLQALFYADTGNPASSEAAYFQSVLSSSTAGVTNHIQFEQSINSLWPTVGENPYNINGVNSTVVHRLDCGTGQTGSAPNGCGVAMDIVPNPSSFNFGITIADGAINTSGGTSVGSAIAMPLMDGVVWFGSSSAYSASIYSPSASVLDFTTNASGGQFNWIASGANIASLNAGELQPATTNTMSLGDASHVFSSLNTSSVSTGTITVTGASSAGSYSTTGAVSSASLSATGVVSAGSFSTSGSISTGTLAATGAITPSTTAGIVGTTAANNANAGSVGEYLSNSSSGSSLTSASAGNCTSLSLTAGDWDVSGTVQFVPASSTVITIEQSSISTTSAANGPNSQSQVIFLTHNANQGDILSTGYARVNVSATTTVYAVGSATFSGGTLNCNGYIHARRVR